MGKFGANFVQAVFYAPLVYFYIEMVAYPVYRLTGYFSLTGYFLVR